MKTISLLLCVYQCCSIILTCPSKFGHPKLIWISKRLKPKCRLNNLKGVIFIKEIDQYGEYKHVSA